jgi:hypothetical protein
VRLGEVVLILADKKCAEVGRVAALDRLVEDRPGNTEGVDDVAGRSVRVAGRVYESARAVGGGLTIERKRVTLGVVRRWIGRRPLAFLHLDFGVRNEAAALHRDRVAVVETGARRDRGR